MLTWFQMSMSTSCRKSKAPDSEMESGAALSQIRHKCGERNPVYSCRARSIARITACALLIDSWCSFSGTESATMPAPACT